MFKNLEKMTHEKNKQCLKPQNRDVSKIRNSHNARVPHRFTTETESQTIRSTTFLLIIRNLTKIKSGLSF